MTEETKANAPGAEEAAAAVETPEIEPIAIDLEALTEEGKQKVEKDERRTIGDIAFEETGRESTGHAITRITIQVGRDEYAKEETRLLKDFGKQITLPGFRKGKAPMALVRKRLGEETARETVTQLAANALRQLNGKESFELVGKPHVVSFDVPAGDGPIVFTAELEFVPSVELKKYTGLSVEAEQVEGVEKMLEQRLEQLRQQNAVLEAAPEGAGIDENASQIVLDVEVIGASGNRIESMCRADQAFYDYKQQLPNEVAEALAGAKAGDAVEADAVTTRTNRRGEEIQHSDHYKVTVKEIKISKLPELDDEFAKDLGEYENLDALKAELTKEAEEARNERQREASLGNIYEALAKANPVETPLSMIQQEQMNLVMRDSQELRRIGLSLENVVQDPSKYLADQKGQAERTVHLRMLLDKIGTEEKLEVVDADLDAEIEKMAERAGRKPLAIRARLEAQRQLDGLKGQLAMRKVEDFLLEKNDVKLVEPKPAEAPVES